MSFELSNIEGQIGEQMYIDYLKDNKIKFIDVREDKNAQLLDIDFIIPKGNNDKHTIMELIKHAQPYNRKERQINDGYAVEVKLDKVIHNRYINKNGTLTEGTGNLVYELISHNMPGCLARSYADFILYICIDTFEQNTIFKKAYMINLYNWRMALVNMNNNNFKPFIKALKYVKEKNETIEENIVNILCPIKQLLNIPNVVMDYTEKLEKYFPQNLSITK
jgi:hypothetical protein